MLKGLFKKLANIVLNDIRNGIVSYDKTTYSSRLSILIIFFFLSYAVIAFKMFNVAIFYEDEIKVTYSSENIASRKDILDRNGNLLAANLSTVSIYANPKKILNIEKTAAKLSRAIPELSTKKIKEKLSSQRSFVWIKRNVTPKEQQKINNLGLPGIYYEVSEKRAYPYGNLFSHVLGYVGLDGKGLAGIEKQYDPYLKDFSSNTNLTLTLDAKIQNIAREELKKAITEYNAIGGAVIVQHVKNGEVLAMVSLPDYDPHLPGKAEPNELFNRASLGSYELGSIFKIFTVAMALDKKIIGLNDAYDVSSPIEFPKYTIKDFYGKGGYLSVPEIMMYSSNIGTVQIAFELGNKNQYDYFKSLGFLSKMKTDYPEISTPLYPSFDRWNSINTATISYGYGLSASPLQVIRAFNAVINGGYLYDTYFAINPLRSQITKKIFQEDTSKKMRQLLNLVVLKGSGKKAKIKGYYVGGKSGTANKAVNGKYKDKARISSFISAFPIHDPQYSILIILDEPKGTKKTFGFATGGWTAAPVAGRIIRRMISVYNYPYQQNEAIDKELNIEYDTGDEDKYL